MQQLTTEEKANPQDLSDRSMIKVYYCKCGKSIERACHHALLIGNTSEVRSHRKEFKQAELWGRKVALITIEEYRSTPFMECDIDKNKKR